MRGLRGHRDEGFSLIEVIVAIVILGIVASSALWFFINGMRTSSNLERQQAGVSIATSTMEQSFTYDARTSVTAGVSGLVIGRPQADVVAAFTNAGPGAGHLDIDGVANSYPLYDPAGGTPALPISSVVTRAGVDYNVYTLVGACYRLASASGTQQDCDKAVGYGTTEPATLPVGYARLLRIIVIVTWTPLGDECTGLCTYDVSTLVDPSLDIEWNRIVQPAAEDDTKSFMTTDPAAVLDLLDNDVLGSVPSYPVSIIAGLPAGAGTLGSPASNGTVLYTPPAATKAAWVSGIFDFTYRVRDSRGQTSQAKGHIYLQPASANDNFSAYVGQPQVLNVGANDLGSPKTVTIVTQPGLGTVTAVGTTVTYTPTTAGNDVFTYTYSDASDLISPIATVKVNVQAVSAAPQTVLIGFRTDAATTAGWQDITANLLGGTTAPASITVTGLPKPSTGSPAGGQLRIDGVLYAGGTVTGTKVEFQPPVKSFGEWTFPFALKLGSYTSSSATATMRVWPIAAADSVGNLKKGATYTINAGANDSPKTWASDTNVKVTLTAISPTTCGAWASGSPSTTDLAAGQLRITVPNAAKSGCTATYTLTGGGISSSTTISYSVTDK